MPEKQYDDRLKDYVDVKERLRLFYDKYPDGRVTTDRVEIWLEVEPARVFVWAKAYRTPDDAHPGDGVSWMVLPGSTPYTRGSEVENTETSAWGRAIGATGIGISKSIASADEVASKAGEEKRQYPGLVDGDPPEAADGSLIGTVVKGNSQVSDMGLREGRDGAFIGFKLTQGNRRVEVVAHDELARSLEPILGSLIDQRVTVWGKVEMMSWRKGDRDMKPYPRLHLERIQTDDWTMPPVGEAMPEPLFPDEAA